MTQRRYLLVALLNAVHVDTVKEKSVVAIPPKPAFRPIFEVATTREGSGIALINQTPQTQGEPEASESCSWWRRGRVEPGLKHALVVVVVTPTNSLNMEKAPRLKATLKHNHRAPSLRGQTRAMLPYTRTCHNAVESGTEE